MDYYITQLKKLGEDTNIKIKITTDTGTTNFMDLNADSLKAITEYLTQKINGHHY